jgi:hypothetical protein
MRFFEILEIFKYESNKKINLLTYHRSKQAFGV